MVRIDFSSVTVSDVRGKEQQADFRQQLGEMMYLNAPDELGCTTGRDIYNATGEIELSDEQETIVRAFVQNFPWCARSALLNAMDKGKTI